MQEYFREIVKIFVKEDRYGGNDGKSSSPPGRSGGRKDLRLLHEGMCSSFSRHSEALTTGYTEVHGGNPSFPPCSLVYPVDKRFGIHHQEPPLRITAKPRARV